MTEDQTMRSLLAVHRTELDEREQKITALEGQIQDQGWQLDSQHAEHERTKSDLKRLQVVATERADKITKLEGVIESLKLELADVRAQFTKAREAGDYQEATSE